MHIGHELASAYRKQSRSKTTTYWLIVSRGSKSRGRNPIQAAWDQTDQTCLWRSLDFTLLTWSWTPYPLNIPQIVSSGHISFGKWTHTYYVYCVLPSLWRDHHPQCDLNWRNAKLISHLVYNSELWAAFRVCLKSRLWGNSAMLFCPICVQGLPRRCLQLQSGGKRLL